MSLLIIFLSIKLISLLDFCLCTAREEAARYLIERGAPAGVFDESGLSAVALLIEKLPKVGKDALEQFVVIDRAFRKEYYYLSYLENDPSEWKDAATMKKHKAKMKKNGMKVRPCPVTPLKVTWLFWSSLIHCHDTTVIHVVYITPIVVISVVI